MKLHNIALRTISWLQLVNHLLYCKIIWLKSFLVPLKQPRLISHCVLSPHGVCGSCSYTFVEDDISYAHDSTLCTWSVWHTTKRSANIFFFSVNLHQVLEAGRWHVLSVVCYDTRLDTGAVEEGVKTKGLCVLMHIEHQQCDLHLYGDTWDGHTALTPSAPTDLNCLYLHFHLLTRFVIKISLQFVLRNQSVSTCPRPCNTCCFYVLNVSHPLNDSIQNGRH